MKKGALARALRVTLTPEDIERLTAFMERLPAESEDSPRGPALQEVQDDQRASEDSH